MHGSREAGYGTPEYSHHARSFGLVTFEREGVALDIRFRMLQPHELARAQGFPDSYVFTGNKSERVCRIGNAVTVELATALAECLLA
jgi:DNA (cytosine-5)-methyltransferase 1